MHRPGSRLRRLTLLLLLMNLAVLLVGWAGSHWLGQPAPLVTFNADKVQLLRDVDREGAPQGTKTQAGSQVSPEGAATQAPALAMTANCRQWQGLDADGVARVEAYLREVGVGEKDYDLVVGMPMGWWVYIPPVESAPALQQLMEDARARGVRDMAVIRAGAMANALALGTFPALEGARRHAVDMGRKGLQGVRFAPRPGAGVVRLQVLRGSAAMQHALDGPWPGGLTPQACPAEPGR